MAELLLLQSESPGGVRWQRLPLPACGVVALRPAPTGGLTADPAGTATGVPPDAAALVVADARDGRLQHVWIALTPTYRNNEGGPVPGLTVLRDHDCMALRFDGRLFRLFFVAVGAALIAPFAGPAAVECPWCRQAIQPGEASVTCPACGVACHQHATAACWLASDACPHCGHATALSGGPAWRPAGFALQEVPDVD